MPANHVEDGFRLGRWVSNNRSQGRGIHLSPDRAAALEALLGWTLDAREDDWREGIDHLRRFVAREGHPRVPQGHVEDGLRPGSWVSGRRAAHRKGRLPQERADMLESVPGWAWDARP